MPLGFTETFASMPVLTHATERDVDLLIVEEIVASKEFVVFLAARAGWQRSISEWRVLHSFHRTVDRRETDIHVEILDDQGRVGTILIENKITETEQPGQAASYRAEVDRLHQQNEFAAMILTSPADYQRQNPAFAARFDALISFEDIRNHLADRADTPDAEQSRRLFHRASLFNQAVTKGRRAWEPIPVKVIGDFNQTYVSVLAQRAPIIPPGPSILKPAPPRGSTSMIFNASASFQGLPDGVIINRFAHELGSNRVVGSNYVAVTFARWSAGFKKYRTAFEAEVAEIGGTFHVKTPTLKRPSPGLVLSLSTPVVDNQGHFETQLPLIEEGIAKALLLRQWIVDNRALLELWRDRLSENDAAGVDLPDYI